MALGEQLKAIFNSTSLRLLGADHVLLIPFIICNMQLVRPAADLTVFDVGLFRSLAGIHKGVIGLAAVGAAVCS